MFEFYAEKNKLLLCRRGRVTSGSANVYSVHFVFSVDWESLTRTAVFRAAEARVSVLLGPEGTCNVPWEVLQKPGCALEAGVYGTDAAGETVLPTVWVNLGTILEGVTPGEVIPPTPELWEQALARKGDALGYTENGELGLYSGEELLSSVPVSGGGDEGLEEYDTEDGWHVRKFRNGYVELSIRQTVLIQPAQWQTWTTGFVIASYGLNSMDLPIPLLALYSESDSEAGPSPFLKFFRAGSTLEKTKAFDILRTSAATPTKAMSFSLDRFICGRWK